MSVSEEFDTHPSAKAVLWVQRMRVNRTHDQQPVRSVQGWLQLFSYVRNSLAPALGGQIGETDEDSLMLTFPEVRPAFRAAIAIRQFCNDFNLSAPPQRHVNARMAVHRGSVHSGEDNLIEFVTRMTTRRAGAGEIVISHTARGQLPPWLDADLEDLGKIDAEDGSHPVRAYCLRPSAAKSPSADAPLGKKRPGSPTLDNRLGLAVAAALSRWTAVVMMDVVGFTSLTERNEAATTHR
jgi:class 3 adenylate cyclase